MKRYLIYSLLLFGVFSCIKELNIPKDIYPEKVVVNALFSPDSLLKMHVSLSKSPKTSSDFIHQDYEHINFVENATIRLYKDGQYLQDLDYVENGWYTSSHYPVENSTYRVEVIVLGFEMVWAESYVPRYPEITEQAVCKYIGPAVIDDIDYLARETKIFFKDEIGVDYYGFIGFMGSFTFIDRQKVTDPSLLADVDFSILYGDFFSVINFRDVLFEGQNKTLSFQGSGFGINTTSTGFDLRFGSVSKEYYKYYDALYKHLVNANPDTQYLDPIQLLFMGNPIETYSNINGGLGIFAGYNYKLLPIIYVY